MQEKMMHLLEYLGNIEAPLGIAYTDHAPEGGLTPAVDGHACIINYARMARSKQKAVYFSAETQGCRGGWLYMGFLLPMPDGIAEYVTTGWPGFQGERYLPAPDILRNIVADMDIQPAPARFCVMQPFSAFTGEQKPDLVTFFCRGEALVGLCQLAHFALSSPETHDAVVMPFGAGCSNILAWPMHYQQCSIAKAVVGGIDPSCRPFMGIDELSFTVSYAVMETMLNAVPDSFLPAKTWSGVQKRIIRSQKVWSMHSGQAKNNG